MTKVGLYLMTSKGLAVLKSALAVGAEISHVTTADAVGMQDDAHIEIARIAKEAGLPTFTRAHPPEYAGDWSVAAGWRWMLEPKNLVVLHDSMLPKYRGFSPLITALVNGDQRVGVTAFLATGDDYDAGPVVGMFSMPVVYPARILDVLNRIGPLYRDLAAAVLLELKETGTLRYTAQDHSAATYSIWRDEADYRIDWTAPSDHVLRLIHATSYPFPGAWTINASSDEMGWTGDLGDRIRIQDAVGTADRPFEQRHPGKIAYHIEGDPVIICGSGMVRIFGFEDLPLRTRFV